MNRLKVITLSVIIIFSLLSAVLYTSCKKEACVGVTCFNNASCNGDTCTCLAGFSGTKCVNKNITKIIYQNNSLEDVIVSVKTDSGLRSITIVAGQSFTLKGAYGSSAIGSAVTSPNVSSFTGETISWNLSNTFPATGSFTVPLNVPASYFFLKVINNNLSYYVSEIQVNYNLPIQFTVTGLEINYYSTCVFTVGIGYFYAAANSNVYMYDTYDGYTWPRISFTLPDSVNQAYTAIVN